MLTFLYSIAKGANVFEDLSVSDGTIETLLMLITCAPLAVTTVIIGHSLGLVYEEKRGTNRVGQAEPIVLRKGGSRAWLLRLPSTTGSRVSVRTANDVHYA